MILRVELSTMSGCIVLVIVPILRLIMLPLAYRHSRGWGRHPQLVSY